METKSVWIILVFNGIYFSCLEEGAFESKNDCSKHIEEHIISRHFVSCNSKFDDYKYDFSENHSHGAVLTWKDRHSGYYITACELDIIVEKKDES
jgi:hypothetical protein